MQVSSAASSAHQKLSLSKTIGSEGYLYVYVSNESTLNVDVFFPCPPYPAIAREGGDDLKITHSSPSMVVQANDYYPFGLTFNEYQNQEEEGNFNLYQGKELQEDLGLNTYDFHARMYDPTVARTFQIDPMAEQFYDKSAYSFVNNNPLSFIDPDGKYTVYYNGEKVRGKTKRAVISAYGLPTSSSSNNSEGGGEDNDGNGFSDNQQSDPVDNPKLVGTPNRGKIGGIWGKTRPSWHDGIDIRAEKGTWIKNMLPGTVVATRSSFWPGEYAKKSYGNYIIVESIDAHGNKVRIMYAHLDFVVRKVGEKLKNGELIGRSGNTGNAGYKDLFDMTFNQPAISEDRFHVHIRARKNGATVDPNTYMKTKLYIRIYKKPETDVNFLKYLQERNR